MDNTLGFDEDKNKESAEEWQTGIQSVTSVAAGSRQSLSQQNIYVIPPKTEPLERPLIPATSMEKLSFYRAYTSSSSKIEMMCMQQNDVNRFTWLYVSNVICKSLPMSYVYIFLSSYAPDFHFYLPQMVPIFYGVNWIIVIAARFSLQTMSYDTAGLFYYAISGLLFKVPWNRCINRTMSFDNINYTCMELEEFSSQFKNANNITYLDYFYVSPTNELFTLAQTEYFDHIMKDITCKQKIETCILSIIILFIWILAAVLYNQFYKKYIWKILHYTQIGLCVLQFMIFTHLILSYEDSKIQRIDAGEDDIHSRILMNADFDLLAESMTAPPVAHVISSRTTTEIKPSLDSAVIVISNGIYYIFKALTSYLMKRYCERWVNATIIYWNYGSGSFFYFWPIYFATIKYGAIFAIAFFTLNAIVEYCTFVISFQCLIEVVVCAWRWLKRWYVSAVILIFAILEAVFLDEVFSANSFIFWVGISSLAEVLIIFWVYPIGRLLDDITFHCGAAPAKLRIWSFKILPVFYLIKIYIMLKRFYIFSGISSYFNAMHNSRRAPTYMTILFCLGAAYAVYENVIKGKKGFSQLFKPMPGWGPKDYQTRQLRKQFDFREYIGSQAPRELSRYLIEKSDLACYKLDVRYDVVGSTLPANGIDKMERNH